MPNPVPPLAVMKPHIHLANDTITYMVYDENAEVDAAHIVALRELIEEKDTHSLLLWGILTQLASMNMQISAAAQQQRPDTASLMQEASSAVGAMMKSLGVQMPGAGTPVVDIRRPGEEG